jgi:hypothetical protein
MSPPAFDHFQTQAQLPVAPADQAGVHGVGVAAVGPDQCEAWVLLVDGVQDQLGAGPVLDRGGVHHADQQQPAGVDQQVPFAASGSLPGVVADLFTAAGRLGGLGVQHRCGRFRVAAPGLAGLLAQGVVDVVPHPLGAPVPKPPVRRVPGSQIMWHEPPGAAGYQHVQDRVDDQPVTVLQRPPTPAGVSYRQVPRHHLPHPISQRTRVRSAGVIPATIHVVHKHTILAGVTPSSGHRHAAISPTSAITSW